MWQIEKTNKHCQNCTNTIEVGNDYFSALFQSAHNLNVEKPKEAGYVPGTGESRLVRQDFCSNCWEKRTASGEEPPFSFWRTRITTLPEPPKTPRQILLNFFDNLFIEPEAPAENIADEEPEKELINTTDTKLKSQVKYLFALILMRKRLLKIKESVHKNDIRFLVLVPTKSVGTDNKIYEIPEINISEQELISLRDEFSKLFEFRI
ncbi:MAG: hypothetical protein V1709_06370 [Planctomycetota bacterium]